MKSVIGCIFVLITVFSFKAQVVINEVMVNPQTNATSAQFQSLKMCSQSANGSEYIELYNSSGCPVDISCYLIGFNTNFLTGINGTYRFPTGTVIPANSFLSIGGPNSGATINLYAACNTSNLNTDADRWFLPNGDGYLILWNASGTPVDAVFWTSNPGETSKWGTDSDISLAPTFIAQGTNCTTINSLNGPAQISASSTIVHYAGQSPTIGNVIHRIVDGGSNWATNATPSINACNGTCNSNPNSFNLNASVTQPTCGNNDGVIAFSPTPSGTYFYNWPFSTTGNVSSVNNLSAGSYLVTITNSSGCSRDTTIILSEDCPTSTCNIAQINASMANAGFQPLNVSGYPCALYFFNPNTTNNWNSAQSQAAAVGATLLTVCDLAENNAVWQAAVSVGVTGGLWIGYSDQTTEGSWAWIDGSTCTFTNWNSGEPSNSSCFPSNDGEDGAIIQMANGLWNDVYLGPTGACLNPAAYASLVKVNLCPEVTPVVGAQNVCQGDPVQLSATGIFGSSPYTFTWLDPNGNQLGTGSPFTYSPAADITLTAVVTDQFGCTGDQTISVTTQDCTPQEAGLCCPFDGWDYLLPITITNNAPVATSGNLQTLLILDTQTPISQGKMQASGNDIRFIEGVCTNVIPHYIESGINTAQTNIWVRLPSISPNSSITIYLKYGNPTATSVAVPFTGAANSMFPSVLTVTGIQNLSGNQVYDWIDVPAGSTVTMTNGLPVTLSARKIVFNGNFDGASKGNGPQAGPGAGGAGNSGTGGGGGAYGGNGGGGGTNNGGTAYGTATGTDITIGSGGGGADCPATARGGGALTITGSVIELNGNVNVEGQSITNQCCCNDASEAAGAGSGGGVMIAVDRITGSGLVNAKGGKGQDSQAKEGGGGGGGGRIKFFYSQSNQFSGATQVNGGLAGTGGQSGMQPGQNGTFHAAPVPGLIFNFGSEIPVSIPDVQFSATTVCENNPNVFTDQTTLVSGGTISTWEWNFGVANATSADQNPNYTYGSAGQYTVTLVVTSSTGCVDSIQNQVVVNPGVLADFNGQDVCLGSSINFTDQSSSSASSWQWDFQDGNTSNLENPTHTYTNPGNYDVELVVLTSNGCSDTSNISFSVFPLPNVNAGADQTICLGTSISLNATGASAYVWTPSNVTNGQTFLPNASGNYSVVGTDANGCADDDQVNVTVLPIPIASISVNPLTGFPGDVFTFTNGSSNATAYDWNFGNGQSISTNNSADQTQSYQAPGTYLVYLLASNSLCGDSSALTVTVLTPDVEILAPNVFTVNDDGVNDEWSIVVKNASSVKVDIQNRWGNTMLTLGPNQSWDGTIDGKEATDGVYFYKYEIKDNFGKVFTGHGHFTLIRSN
jgi:gliding motility-associated-like protein